MSLKFQFKIAILNKIKINKLFVGFFLFIYLYISLVLFGYYHVFFFLILKLYINRKLKWLPLKAFNLPIKYSFFCFLNQDFDCGWIIFCANGIELVFVYKNKKKFIEGPRNNKTKTEIQLASALLNFNKIQQQKKIQAKYQSIYLKSNWHFDYTRKWSNFNLF